MVKVVVRYLMCYPPQVCADVVLKSCFGNSRETAKTAYLRPPNSDFRPRLYLPLSRLLPKLPPTLQYRPGRSEILLQYLIFHLPPKVHLDPFHFEPLFNGQVGQVI